MRWTGETRTKRNQRMESNSLLMRSQNHVFMRDVDEWQRSVTPQFKVKYRFCAPR